MTDESTPIPPETAQNSQNPVEESTTPLGSPFAPIPTVSRAQVLEALEILGLSDPLVTEVTLDARAIRVVRQDPTSDVWDYSAGPYVLDDETATESPAPGGAPMTDDQRATVGAEPRATPATPATPAGLSDASPAPGDSVIPGASSGDPEIDLAEPGWHEVSTHFVGDGHDHAVPPAADPITASPSYDPADDTVEVVLPGGVVGRVPRSAIQTKPTDA